MREITLTSKVTPKVINPISGKAVEIAAPTVVIPAAAVLAEAPTVKYDIAVKLFCNACFLNKVEIVGNNIPKLVRITVKSSTVNSPSFTEFVKVENMELILVIPIVTCDKVVPTLTNVSAQSKVAYLLFFNPSLISFVFYCNNSNPYLKASALISLFLKAATRPLRSFLNLTEPSPKEVITLFNAATSDSAPFNAS
jgi:hypothetical protein